MENMKLEVLKVLLLISGFLFLLPWLMVFVGSRLSELGVLIETLTGR